jgi:arylsulfatase
VSFLIQWPKTIPAGSVSNEIVHQMDLFSTIAGITGGRVPDDRVLDSIDMTDFFKGKTNKSGRESVVVYNGGEVYGVKWRDWKMMIKEIDGMGDLNAPSALPSFYNLLQDPKEMHPLRLAPANLWIRYPASQVLIDHAVSLKKEPPIPEGTPDPYTPKQ